MKRILLFSVMTFLLSCDSKQSSSDSIVHLEENARGVHDGDHDVESHGETANEHMHKSSVDELVKRFESSERDEYQKPQEVMDFLGDISGKKILDIGAGSGYFSVRLAKKGAHVIAADVNDEFQSFLSDRIDKNSLSNIETRKIPYDDPGLQPEEVDIAFIVNTYHHIEDRPDYFSKVKDGLKKDGELVIIDFFDFDTPVGPKHHKVSIDTVIDELRRAGFTSFEVEVDLLPYQYIIKSK